MKIVKVKLRNFRVFDDETIIEFSTKKNFVTLVGENGTGKTSVLEAINLATSFGFVEGRIKEDDFYNPDKDIEIEVELDNFFFVNIPDGWQTRRVPSKTIKCTIKHREKGSPGKAFSAPYIVEQKVVPYVYDDRNEISSDNDNKIVKAVRKEGDKYKFVRENNKEIPISPNNLLIQNNLSNFPNIFYFSKNREQSLKRGYATVFQKIVDELNWRFLKKYKEENRSQYIDLWNRIYSIIISKVLDPKQEKIIEPLQEKLKNILGDVYKDLEISLFHLRQPFNQAFFSLRTDDKQIGLTNFGSGELFIIAFYFLKLTSELSKEQIIFLIDEPEMHLHPQLQESLFEEFKETPYQIIYTTHSNLMIDIGEWQSIKRFAKEENKIIIYPNEINLSEEVEGREIREHLNEIKKYYQHQTIFKKENNHLFFAKKCLLVEGPAEKYGLPVIAKKFNKSLNNLTTIMCEGKTKIPHYQLLCKSFGIPYFVVFDEDNDKAEKKPEINELIKRLSQNSLYFSFINNFEKEFGIGGEHKTSKVLEKINNISSNEIPETVKDLLTKLEEFVVS